MTREEAAMIVERIRHYMEGSELWTDGEFEAMDMAVEVLRESCEENHACNNSDNNRV